MIEKQKRTTTRSIDSLQTTKRAKIELDNGMRTENDICTDLDISSVQIMVKRIKDDFNSYFILNEKLSQSILRKVVDSHLCFNMLR